MKLSFSNLCKVVNVQTFTELTSVNPHTPVAQKVADEVVFGRFQGEGVEFF